MTLRLVLRSSAHRELLEHIDHYLSVATPEVALRIDARIQEAFRYLQDHPQLGRKMRLKRHVNRDLRAWGVQDTPFLVVYRPHPDAIEVVHNPHIRQNWRGWLLE